MDNSIPYLLITGGVAMLLIAANALPSIWYAIKVEIAMHKFRKVEKQLEKDFQPKASTKAEKEEWLR